MSDLYKGISVFRQAKYQIPDAYIHSFLKACPSTFGVVAVKKKDATGLEIHAMDHPADFGHVKKLDKAFENHRVLYFGGNFPKNFLKDAAQPYRVLAKDNTALIAATLCGDFTKLVPPGDTNHPAAFYAAHMFILPKLQQLYRLCKEDINALYEEIKGPQFIKEMKELIGAQGGIIAFFINTPETPSYISFHKSLPTHKQFLWGDTSDVLDYQSGIAPADAGTKLSDAPKKPKFTVEPDDDEEEEVTYTPKKKPEKKEVKQQKAAEVPIITSSGNDKVLKEYVDAQTGGTMRVVLVDGKEVLLWYPPYQITKRRALRRLYKAVSGKELTNKEIDARVGVAPKDQRFYKSFAEMGAALTAIPTAVSVNEPERFKAPEPEATERSSAKNKVTGSTVNAPVAESADKVGTNIYSGLSKKAQYDVLKILKALDNNGQAILHPEVELEDTNPAMYKEIGYPSMEQMFGWKPETRLAICNASPEFASRYIGDLIRFCYNLKKELDKFYAEEQVVTYTPKKKAKA